jgi:23S rRNA pseudouridine1911/1915/1917 synthase
VRKTYLALVHGSPAGAGGRVTLPIGRHPTDRKRMSTVSRKSRRAETRWRVCERFEGASLLELELQTGRTHQIRVHCAAMGHPVVGDAVYRRRKFSKRLKPSKDWAQKDPLGNVGRQMLHARRLEFTHPQSGLAAAFEAPLPADMQTLLRALKNPAPA